MNTYKHWKPNAVDFSQEPDRQRRKLFTSSSHHKTPEIRAAGRDKEDTKHRSSRGHVSGGPLLSSSTPAPTYPTGAQSSATASKAPHNAPTQPSQNHTAYMSQKAPLPTATLPQETHSTAQRHWETAPDPRATSHRTATPMERASLMSPDPVRHAEDLHKSSRHRPRHPSTPALENAEPQTASTWPRPPSILKKVSPEGREREKEQGRIRPKEESKATAKAKDRRRAERPQEQISRDQRERDPRYEEERRHYKEERRREKERQRDEQRHDERRHEQRVKDDHVNKSTREQERRREARDGHIPVTPLGKDPRLMRVIVKDSDESDNSLTKPPGSIRPRRQHTKDQTMTAVVPTVLRQSTYPPVPAQVPTTQAANNPTPNHSESRQAVILVQPSHATLGASNERAGSKPQRSSPPQNSTVPYPPGYAVSASDSEHVSRREHRQKIAESARLIERPRTSGGHRTSIAHDAVSKPPVSQPVQPTIDKSFHKSEKSKGGFGAWLFHREPSNPHPKSTDPHIVDQNVAQPTGRVVLTPSTRNDIPEAIPQVVSIRAGEGPADSLQEYGVRRAAPPAVTPVATDAVARQPVSTVQILQQSQVYDKQYRDAPRTVTGAQLDPPSHLVTRVSSPQPWVQPAQWSTEPRPLSPVPRPPVVPSPVVFHTPLASPPTLVDTQQHLAPPPLAPHGPSSHKESYSHPRDTSFQSPAVNGRPPAPPVHSHTVPLPTTGIGQRSSPRGSSPMVHDVAGSKHARHSSVPMGYANAQPPYVTSPPSRPIAPGLAAAFPIREDNADTYRQLSQGGRPQDPQPSRDAFDTWDRHRNNPDVARMVVSTVPSSSERTPRSTKASPNLHPRPVNQGTPPKPPLQPFDAPTFPPQSSTNPNATHVHDTSRPGIFNMPNQNPNSSPYPATSIYPSSSSRNQVEVNSAINNLPVASASSNNPSPKTKSGNPSPRSRLQVIASSQGPTPAAAVHLTTRTPSHETGSTTLLGQTPSSQGSASMQLPMSPSAHPHAILPRATTHGGQQIVHAPAPVSDSLGDRNGNAINHTQVPNTRQTSSRHYHSNSAPVISAPSLAQSPPPVQSQTQPLARPAPLSPTPIRSYLTTQTLGDLHVARTPIPGYSTSVPNPRQQRIEIPSPSQESELNTPSSLAVSMKLPIVSDEPLAPVMSTQSYQEPKKKSGFFQGLGLFRSKSSAQKRHPHESNVFDSRAQKTTTTTTKLASSKPPTPLHYDSDSKVVTTPAKLKKPKAVHTPVSAPAPKPPQPTPVAVPVPAPSFLAAPDERFSSAPNAFGSFRIVSKRYRTMSGASAEAVDGTNAGASTVLTSPANSTRSPTPKLIPPQRDPQQATYVWRNREEAEALQRGKARRRRPGVHFEGYEDHPQAERHRYKYATRARDKARS